MDIICNLVLVIWNLIIYLPTAFFTISVNESTFKGLDYFIYSNGQKGIRTMPVLLNNWASAYGGRCWVVQQSNSSSKNGAATCTDAFMDQFYNDSGSMAIYKSMVNYTLNRVNNYSGIKYKEDKAIFGWQLMNEPRVKSVGLNRNLIRDWAKNMSAFVKSQDTNHIVGLGIEGFGYVETWGEGTDMINSTNGTGVDFATVELHPDQWGYFADRSENATNSGWGGTNLSNNYTIDWWTTGGGYSYNSRYSSNVPAYVPKLARHSYQNWVSQNVNWSNQMNMPVILAELALPTTTTSATTTQLTDTQKARFFDQAINSFFKAGGDIIAMWNFNHDDYASRVKTMDDNYSFYYSSNPVLQAKSKGVIDAYNFTMHNNTGGTSWVSLLNNYAFTFTYNITFGTNPINNCSLWLSATNQSNQNTGFFFDQSNVTVLLDSSNGTNSFNRTFSTTDINATWYVSCADNTNVITNSTKTNIILANIPVVTLNSPANNFINRTASNFSLGYIVQTGLGISKCELYINGVLNQTNLTTATNVNQIFQFNTTANASSYGWQVLCTDTAGAIGYSEPRTFFYDTGVINVTLTGPANNIFANNASQNYTVNISSFGPISTVVWVLDGIVQYINNVAGTVYTMLDNYFIGLAEGLHTWYYQVTDFAGITNTSETRNITIDTTYPLIDWGANVLADNSNSSGNNVYLNVTWTETNPSSITFWVDGISHINSIPPNTYEDNFTGLADGTHTYYVVVCDLAGWCNQTSTRTLNTQQDIRNYMASSNFNQSTASTSPNFTTVYSFNYTSPFSNNTNNFIMASIGAFGGVGGTGSLGEWRILINNVSSAISQKTLTSGEYYVAKLSSNSFINNNSNVTEISLQHRRISGTTVINTYNSTIAVMGMRDLNNNKANPYNHYSFSNSTSSSSYVRLFNSNYNVTSIFETMILMEDIDMNKSTTAVSSYQIEITRPNGIRENCSEIGLNINNGQSTSSGLVCIFKNNEIGTYNLSVYGKNTAGSTTFNGNLNIFSHLEINSDELELKLKGAGYFFNSTYRQILNSSFSLDEDGMSVYANLGFLFNNTVGGSITNFQLKLRNSTGVMVVQSLSKNRNPPSTIIVSSEPMLQLDNAINLSLDNYTIELWGSVSSGLSYITGGSLSMESIRDVRTSAFAPPTTPLILSPVDGNYSSQFTFLNISYTASMSPESIQLKYYNISLVNLDQTFNKTIIGNNSLNTNYTWNFTGTADGNYLLRIEICDILDSCANKYSLQFTLDSTNPNATLLTPVNNTNSNNITQNLTINITDNIGIKNASLYINGTYNSTITFSGTINAVVGIVVTLVDGIYNWFYQIFDWADNSYTTNNNTLEIDSTPPVITLSTLSPNPMQLGNDTVHLVWNASDIHLQNAYFNITNSSGYVFVNNNITHDVYLDPSLFPNIGNYNIQIYANDSFGNSLTYPSYLSVLFAVDTIAPELYITSPSNNSQITLNGNTTMNFFVNDSFLQSCYYNQVGPNNVTNISSNTVINCSAGINTISTYLDLGNYLINIYANDSSGNLNQTSINLNIIQPTVVQGTTSSGSSGWVSVYDGNITNTTNYPLNVNNNQTEPWPLNKIVPFQDSWADKLSPANHTLGVFFFWAIIAGIIILIFVIRWIYLNYELKIF